MPSFIDGTVFPMPSTKGLVAIVPDDAEESIIVADATGDQAIAWGIACDALDEPPTGRFEIGPGGMPTCRMVQTRRSTPIAAHHATMRLICYLRP